MVYIVNKICDYEYGCTEVDKVFDSLEKAENYVEKQSDNGFVTF